MWNNCVTKAVSPKCTIVAMEQANVGNFIARNNCWLAAVNDRVGLDALASADMEIGFLS